LQQQPLRLGDPVDTLGIDGGFSLLAPLSSQQSPQPSITVCGPLRGDLAHLLEDFTVLNRRPSSPISHARSPCSTVSNMATRYPKYPAHRSDRAALPVDHGERNSHFFSRAVSSPSIDTGK
jgi:hypothetical protein